MRVRGSLDIGVSTHTGMQRHANEDDYLVLCGAEAARGADLVAIADGMGGMAGGAEASRAALRGLALGFCGAGAADALDRLRRGFRGPGGGCPNSRASSPPCATWARHSPRWPPTRGGLRSCTWATAGP